MTSLGASTVIPEAVEAVSAILSEFVGLIALVKASARRIESRLGWRPGRA